MSLHYILDAYNIMHHAACRYRRTANDPRYGFIAFIRDEGFCGSARNPVTVVFDGFPNGFAYDDGRFSAVFSGEEKADDRIKRRIESGVDRKNTVVVSDDREIYDFARLHGVPALHVEEFLCRKRGPRGADDGSGKSELTYEKMNAINRELREKWLKE